MHSLGVWNRRRRFILYGSAFVTAGIAVMDRYSRSNLGLGFLYFVPLAASATALRAWQVAVAAALCTVLRESFAPWAFSAGLIPRLALVFTGYAGSSLFIHELLRRQRQTARNLRVVRRHMRLRHREHRRLRSLMETTPVALVITDGEGRIELANDAALRMLEIGDQPLHDVYLGRHIPIVESLLRSEQMRGPFHTVLESSGQRTGGEPFLGRLWISNTISETGPTLAVVIADVSEEIRELERAGMQSLMTNSRVLLGAFAHEVRNYASAVSATALAFSRKPELKGLPEVGALALLAQGLQQVASADLGARCDPGQSLNLSAVLTDLQIVLDPDLKTGGIELELDVPEGLPRVMGERHAVLQAFLNLANNAIQALREQPEARLRIAACELGSHVSVRFHNNGPPPPDPAGLFQPFHSRSRSSGLGLYISRSLIRSFGGNVRYEPAAHGCCFTVDFLPERR
jgi:two-component system, LuxR family, sensor kinase FixL